MIELPTQLIDWQCELEARNPERNVARAYRLSATQDLFGHWIIDMAWGRIGTRGSGMRVSFEDGCAARNFINRTLARRASAETRIGARYTTRKDVAVGQGR